VFDVPFPGLQKNYFVLLLTLMLKVLKFECHGGGGGGGGGGAREAKFSKPVTGNPSPNGFP